MPILAAGEIMLEISNLSAWHGLLSAVRNVSFSVGPGEVLAIIGANGAGKTTMFRAISGVHRNCDGRVRLNGNDLSQLVANRRVAEGLALVPEGRRLFGEMSVRENLLVAGENGRKGDWTVTGVVKAFPALAPIMDVPAGNLSGGQRQAVAIGRALMSNPEAILMDEVSLGLSPIAVDGLYESLGALRRHARTALVVVEQDLTRALGFADRVICMREGAVVLEGRADQFSREAITNAYFGIDAKLEEETYA